MIKMNYKKTIQCMIIYCVVLAAVVGLASAYEKSDYVRLVSNTYHCTGDCQTTYEVCALDKDFSGFDLNLHGRGGSGRTLLKSDGYPESALAGNGFNARNLNMEYREAKDVVMPAYTSCTKEYETTENGTETKYYDALCESGTKTVRQYKKWMPFNPNLVSAPTGKCFEVKISGSIGWGDWVDNIMTFGGYTYNEWAPWVGDVQVQTLTSDFAGGGINVTNESDRLVVQNISPDSNVIWDSFIDTDDDQWCGGEYDDWMGFNFTADRIINLTGVHLMLKKFGSPDKLTVYLYDVDSQGAPSSKLAELGNIKGVDITTGPVEYTIQGNESYDLSFGNKYAIVWRCEPDGSGHNFNNKRDRVSPADTNSTSFSNELGPPTSLYDSDFWYKLEGYERVGKKSWIYESEAIDATDEGKVKRINASGSHLFTVEARVAETSGGLDSATYFPVIHDTDLQSKLRYLQYRINGSEHTEIFEVNISKQEIFANETTGDTAIADGCTANIANAVLYPDQQVYARNKNNNQSLGRFDYLCSGGNRRWAINYVTGSETFTNMFNVTPVLYVLEFNNRTAENITQIVGLFINSTT